MPFAYYARLSKRDQATYRQSDAILEIRLPHPALLHPFVGGLRAALEADDRTAVALACRHLVRGLTLMLVAPAESARAAGRSGRMRSGG